MRRNYCSLLNVEYINEKVKLCGWISNIKIFKEIIFINLRDHTGIIQCFVKKECKYVWKLAISLTIESCVKVYGKVLKKNSFNLKLNSIEISIYNLIIYNYSDLLPININVNNSEKIRFKYRYLDLRTSRMFNILKIRSKIKYFIHSFLNKNDFLDIETPFLSKSFPEGSRNYIVPSRIYKGMNYSLPQSPQIFKQLLMISGINKYYQIVKCFRDEDLRSDRQPEFTQIDIELSFSNFNYIKNLVEKLIIKLFLNFKNIVLSPIFKIIDYNYSIDKYGTDKPDLRNHLKFNSKISNFLVDYFLEYLDKKISNLFVIKIDNVLNFEFCVYKKIFFYFNSYLIDNFICIKITSFIKNRYIYEIYGDVFKINDNFMQIFIRKFNFKMNDLIFLMFFKKKLFSRDLVDIRNFIYSIFFKFKKNNFSPVWIINYPMFFLDKFNKIKSVHHPFTMPINLSYSKNNILSYTNILSRAYDLVINGYEIGSGSVRIHDYKIQYEIFKILGIPCNKNSKYSFFLEALKYGTPPHLGLALGLDRIIMLLTDIENIKDVISFPKTTSGLCLLTNSPD